MRPSPTSGSILRKNGGRAALQHTQSRGRDGCSTSGGPDHSQDEHPGLREVPRHPPGSRGG
eukprot:12617510-Alexandrium_andersonii.AAC.1